VLKQRDPEQPAPAAFVGFDEIEPLAVSRS